MYRPTAAAKAVRAYVNMAVAAGTTAIEIAGEALKGFMITTGLYEQAMRENRQRDRQTSRNNHFQRHRADGLNGKRAVARRLRQIERGSLTVANGLVR